MFEALTKRLDALTGDKSVWFYNALTGETYAYNAEQPLVAASVIKLPILVAAHRAASQKKLCLDEKIGFSAKDMLPSCGVLTYIQPFGVCEMSIAALLELMIIVSDNSATNLLIDYLGMDAINESSRALGLVSTVLRRKLFDAKQAALGVQNTITAREIGELLVRIAHLEGKSALGPKEDEAMLQTLLHQRLNGKIPFALSGVTVAHKTGEDSDITHDVGIVFEKQTMRPLCVMCFCSEHVCVPVFERFIQDAAQTMVDSVL